MTSLRVDGGARDRANVTERRRPSSISLECMSRSRTRAERLVQQCAVTGTGVSVARPAPAPHARDSEQNTAQNTGSHAIMMSLPGEGSPLILPRDDAARRVAAPSRAATRLR